MVTVASIEAMIRECSMLEERLSAQLADAGRDAPESLIELVDTVRQLKAELIAVHPARLRARTNKPTSVTPRGGHYSRPALSLSWPIPLRPELEMPTTIQQLTIEDGRVQLTIGDAPEPEEATTWIYAQVPLTVDQARPLAEPLLEALQTARSALNDEIARLQSLAGRASGRSP